MARRDPNDFISLLMTDTGKGSVHFSTITDDTVTKTPERLPFYAGVSLAVGCLLEVGFLGQTVVAFTF